MQDCIFSILSNIVGYPECYASVTLVCKEWNTIAKSLIIDPNYNSPIGDTPKYRFALLYMKYYYGGKRNLKYTKDILLNKYIPSLALPDDPTIEQMENILRNGHVPLWYLKKHIYVIQCARNIPGHLLAVRNTDIEFILMCKDNYIHNIDMSGASMNPCISIDDIINTWHLLKWHIGSILCRDGINIAETIAKFVNSGIEIDNTIFSRQIYNKKNVIYPHKHHCYITIEQAIFSGGRISSACYSHITINDINKYPEYKWNYRLIIEKSAVKLEDLLTVLEFEKISTSYLSSKNITYNEYEKYYAARYYSVKLPDTLAEQVAGATREQLYDIKKSYLDNLLLSNNNY